MLQRFIHHWSVKARASHTRRDEAKACATRMPSAAEQASAVRHPDALPEHDTYDEVVEASFPASDPPPYVRDPTALLSHH